MTSVGCLLLDLLLDFSDGSLVFLARCCRLSAATVFSMVEGSSGVPVIFAGKGKVSGVQA